MTPSWPEMILINHFYESSLMIHIFSLKNTPYHPKNRYLTDFLELNGIGLQGLVDLRQVFAFIQYKFLSGYDSRFLIGWRQIKNLSQWFGTNFRYGFYNEWIYLESNAQPNLIFISYITVLGLVTWQNFGRKFQKFKKIFEKKISITWWTLNPFFCQHDQKINALEMTSRVCSRLDIIITSFVVSWLFSFSHFCWFLWFLTLFVKYFHNRFDEKVPCLKYSIHSSQQTALEQGSEQGSTDRQVRVGPPF